MKSLVLLGGAVFGFMFFMLLLAPQAEANTNIPSVGYSLRVLGGSSSGSIETWYEGGNIDGLSFDIVNDSQLPQTLSFPKGCKLNYEIYNTAGVKVYDSAKDQRCKKSRKESTIRLAVGESYSITFLHKVSDFKLSPGTYRLKVFSKDSGYGTAEITFKVAPAMPSCTVSAKPFQIVAGERTKLTWSTQNAKSILWKQDSAANNIGLPVKALKKTGSKWYEVGGKGDQTVTLLVSNANGSAQCSTLIQVEPKADHN
jgi:hypothetical protein